MAIHRHEHDIRLVAAFVLLLVATFAQAGFYRSRLALSLLDDLPRLAGRRIIAVATVLLRTQLVLGNLVSIPWAVITLHPRLLTHLQGAHS